MCIGAVNAGDAFGSSTFPFNVALEASNLAPTPGVAMVAMYRTHVDANVCV